MAFAQNNNTAAASNVSAIPENKKAVGYLNFYLPGKQADQRKKVGSIPLRAGYANEKSLADWLQADPANLAILINKLQLEFNAVGAEADSGFDLPGM